MTGTPLRAAETPGAHLPVSGQARTQAALAGLPPCVLIAAKQAHASSCDGRVVSAGLCGENGGMTTSSASDVLDTVEHETGPSPQWSVLWLHGLGADGHDFAPLVPELVRPGWPSLRFVFPHAPMRAVTINNGVRMRAWYDIVGMDFPTRADSAGIEESIVQVEALIAREQARGIAPERLLLAGFSQGGAITLAAGLRRKVPLAGLIALSTYLPGAAQAASHLDPAATAQPVFMAHGSGDPVIPLVHAEQSARVLGELGFGVQWHRYPMAHQVCAEEIRDLGDWMAERFAL